MRTLMDGRVVTEFDAVVNLNINTYCPGKWLAVDLETGDIWAGSEAEIYHWRRATSDDLNTLRHVVTVRTGAQNDDEMRKLASVLVRLNALCRDQQDLAAFDTTDTPEWLRGALQIARRWNRDGRDDV